MQGTILSGHPVMLSLNPVVPRPFPLSNPAVRPFTRCIRNCTLRLRPAGNAERGRARRRRAGGSLSVESVSVPGMPAPMGRAGVCVCRYLFTGIHRGAQPHSNNCLIGG